MCGIAGMVDLGNGIDFDRLEAASGTMVHRGPDSSGSFIRNPIGLIHRRLSIIDIEGGVQPMFNEDGSLVTIFNGEIYNFRELRAELQSLGHVFSTSSDTEVILHGFEQWGPDCVLRFEGMFALAVCSPSDNSIFLSRDRCGEKPLYIFESTDVFAFASELQALQVLIGRALSPDPCAVYLYLRLGCIPAPFSFLDGVKKLPAGHWLQYRNGRSRTYRYFFPPASADSSASEDELSDELETCLRRSVRKMLAADVPLGSFLSGGLDSSLIVAMMASEGPPPQTFSISFPNASFDESRYAEQVAQSLGTRHTVYEVNFGDSEECLSIMDAFGEPFADSSAIPVFHLSRETRKNVTVVLSGDGSDELFGGYRRYSAQRFLKPYLALPASLRRRVLYRTLSVLRERDVYYADSILKCAKLFMERAENIEDTWGLMPNTVFTHDEVTSLFPDLSPCRSLFGELDHSFQCSADPVQALMDLDQALYLPDDILVKVDRMSMRHSLEVRCPYLHPAVLELAGRIPLSMKIRGQSRKHILKKIAMKYLSRSIVSRKKHGFTPPLAAWFRNSDEHGIMNLFPVSIRKNAARTIVKLHRESGQDCSAKIFALAVLGRFLKE